MRPLYKYKYSVLQKKYICVLRYTYVSYHYKKIENSKNFVIAGIGIFQSFVEFKKWWYMQIFFGTYDLEAGFLGLT